MCLALGMCSKKNRAASISMMALMMPVNSVFIDTILFGSKTELAFADHNTNSADGKLSVLTLRLIIKREML